MLNIFTKQPSEILPVSIDFGDLLATGETIASKSVVAYDSANAVVTSTVISASTISTSSIIVTVKAGTNANKYKITIQATTSLGNVYEEDLWMYVKEL